VTGAAPLAPLIDIEPDAARAALGGRRIGPHMALGPGLQRALDRARTIGASTIQVFTDNPSAWRRRSEPRDGVEAFRAGLESADIGPLAVHAPYLVNLATPDDELRARSVEVIVSELLMARRFGAAYLNVHIGSHRRSSIDAGVARVGECLGRALEAVANEPDLPIIVLENSAGQGDSIGVTAGELGAIAAAADAAGCDPARVAICLDTAHLWGAGHALDDPAAVDRLLVELDATIGLDRLAMIHLNDARPARGSRMDRHEHLGDGGIGWAGMRYLLRDPRLASLPTYLETPDMDEGWDAVNMHRVRQLIADAPVDGEVAGNR
jgi:deoxyribonuclease-4